MLVPLLPSYQLYASPTARLSATLFLHGAISYTSPTFQITQGRLSGPGTDHHDEETVADLVTSFAVPEEAKTESLRQEVPFVVVLGIVREASNPPRQSPGVLADLDPSYTQ